MRFVFVPVAWPLTVVASGLGLSPNAVTALRAVLAVGGLFFVAQPSAPAFYFGLAIFMLSVVGDSIDGNLCRLHDRASYFGKYFDGLVDMAIDLGFPFALSLHLWSSNQGSPEVIVAGTSAVLALSLVFVLIHRLPMFEMVLEKDTPPATAIVSHPRLNSFFESSLGRALMAFDSRGMNFVFDVRYLGLLFALMFNQLEPYLFALAAVYVGAALLFGVSRIARGYRILDVRRRSRSAA